MDLLCKFTPDGAALVHSTYLGGPGDDFSNVHRGGWAGLRANRGVRWLVLTVETHKTQAVMTVSVAKLTFWRRIGQLDLPRFTKRELGQWRPS